jgi:hypothetical protein
MLQRQISHLNGRRIDRRQVWASHIFSVWLRLVLYCDYVHSHDYVCFLLVACTILLHNRIYMKGNCQSKLQSSTLLYDWRFTANQFVLAPCPLRPTTKDFLQLNSCGNSPLWREDGLVSYECAWLFVKCAFRTYVIEISSFCTTNKSSVYCDGSLVIWTVVSFTTAKFKPIICSTVSRTTSPRYIAPARTA